MQRRRAARSLISYAQARHWTERQVVPDPDKLLLFSLVCSLEGVIPFRWCVGPDWY